MSIDYGERERQFLEALKADTGRTLEEWMAAISAQGLTQRNDIIDWLRRQNFMFSKASWLERIHNNGGQPIYSGAGSPRAQAQPRNQTPRPLRAPTLLPPELPRLTAAAPSSPAPPPSLLPAAVVIPLPQRAPGPGPAAPRPAIPPAAVSPPPASTLSPAPVAGASPIPAQTDPAALEALLARAKAFRPLAAYLIAEIRKAIPDVSVSAHDGFVSFRIHDRDFAIIAISPKELRLALALKSRQPDTPLLPAKMSAFQGAPSMTQMAVLNDARQITASLLAAVTQAAAEA